MAGNAEPKKPKPESSPEQEAKKSKSEPSPEQDAKKLKPKLNPKKESAKIKNIIDEQLKYEKDDPRRIGFVSLALRDFDPGIELIEALQSEVVGRLKGKTHTLPYKITLELFGILRYLDMQMLQTRDLEQERQYELGVFGFRGDLEEEDLGEDDTDEENDIDEENNADEEDNSNVENDADEEDNTDEGNDADVEDNTG